MVKYEGHELGSTVWAISEYYVDGKPSDNVSIVPAVVHEVTFTRNGSSHTVSYFLKTPSGGDWCDSVDAERVFVTFEDACAYMKPVWEKSDDYS